jgi:hypothetical protein
MADTPATSLIPVFGRMTWMLAGPLVLFVTLYYVLTSGTGWTTPADGLYFVILAAMALGRWAEFRGGSPRRSTGEPATRQDLHRYLLGLLILGPALWALANLLGNHVLAR